MLAYRFFNGVRNVLDAVALSPAQIKQMLERMPWDQETEERFEGVDGRKVLSLPPHVSPLTFFRPFSLNG